MSKQIYCIETWWHEQNHLGYPKESFRDGSFWGCMETPWKIGCWDFIQEFEDEEQFKKELLNIINGGGIIGKVFIEEKPDDYKTAIKLNS